MLFKLLGHFDFKKCGQDGQQGEWSVVCCKLPAAPRLKDWRNLSFFPFAWQLPCGQACIEQVGYARAISSAVKRSSRVGIPSPPGALFSFSP